MRPRAQKGGYYAHIQIPLNEPRKRMTGVSNTTGTRCSSVRDNRRGPPVGRELLQLFKQVAASISGRRPRYYAKRPGVSVSSE